jgi:hypothetical protein
VALGRSTTGTTKKRNGRLPFRFFGAVAGIWLLTASYPSAAQERFVRITKLSDVNFGLISNVNADAVQRQNLCVFSGRPNLGYNVRATGSGPGGSFRLLNGAATMPFEVQWGATAGQTSGFTLSPNVVRTGLVSQAAQQICSNGPPTTATLIVLLRAAALQAAPTGNYSGTLTLVIAPE